MTIYASPLSSLLSNLHLYLDPGAGSMLLQLAIAALLGIAVIVRTQWSKIKNLFVKKNADSTEDDEKDE